MVSVLYFINIKQLYHIIRFNLESYIKNKQTKQKGTYQSHKTKLFISTFF